MTSSRPMRMWQLETSRPQSLQQTSTRLRSAASKMLAMRDAIEFFRRTYLTEGLSDLLSRAVRRLSGNDNAPPVINLQTNFGGGKTHSMLALWHVERACQSGSFRRRPKISSTRVATRGLKVNRVAIVGNHFSPSGETKDDGTHVNTIWGELAWQLGAVRRFHWLRKPTESGRLPVKRCTSC